MLSAPVRVDRVWVTPPARMGEPPVEKIGAHGKGDTEPNPFTVRKVGVNRLYNESNEGIDEGTRPQTAHLV